MSDNSPVCVPCSKVREPMDGLNEMRFKIKRNGLYILYGKTQTQHCNLWRCPGCGHEILLDFITIPTDTEGRKSLIETARKWGDLALETTLEV